MYREKRILGLIPARGGSKGLPQKNIMPLLGKPLIEWTIEDAKQSRYLDYFLVTTDDLQIAEVAKKAGAPVPFMRPSDLATDTATSSDVIIHAIDFLKNQGELFDYFVLLEPTSPLREPEDIDLAIQSLIDNAHHATSIVGVAKVEATHPAFDAMINPDGILVPWQGGSFKTLRRQDLSEVYFFEGTIYASKIDVFFKEKTFLHDQTLPYIVPKWKAPEVDDFIDFIWIEATLKNLERIKNNERPKKQ